MRTHVSTHDLTSSCPVWQADLVSMARPFLADPFFLTKAAEGTPERINTCIACAHMIASNSAHEHDCHKLSPVGMIAMNSAHEH